MHLLGKTNITVSNCFNSTDNFQRPRLDFIYQQKVRALFLKALKVNFILLQKTVGSGKTKLRKNNKEARNRKTR